MNMAEGVGFEPIFMLFLSLLIVAFLCQDLHTYIQRIALVYKGNVASMGIYEKENLCQTVSEPTCVPRLCLMNFGSISCAKLCLTLKG